MRTQVGVYTTSRAAGLHPPRLHCRTMPGNSTDRHVPKKEAMGRLGVSLRTLERLIADGAIESVLIRERCRVVSEQSIADYIERRKAAQPPRSPNPKAKPRKQAQRPSGEPGARATA
jgi:hypothetical protein